ncbi:MAG: M23 family metallopeptidase [Chloroflexi bacterium]|nr:M23 family metallopeptidase [Chloroflexota bacterium]
MRLLKMFLLLGLLLFMAGCRAEGLGLVTLVEPTLTQVPVAVLAVVTPEPSPTDTAVPTSTIPPTATTEPTETPLPTSTSTPEPTATLVPTSTPEVVRTCPDPAPLKPAYDRYYLSARTWPVPDPVNAASHFWLAKPLPGGGRFLVNQTYPYGYDGNGRYLLHNGVDSAETLGTPLLAVADGTVIVAQADDTELHGWRCDWYGHLVVIELDETWLGQPIYALYGHVLNITVEVGQKVQLGEQVAEVGFGGAALVPHLHFELRVGSNSFDDTRNPMLWIDPGVTRGVIAGRLVDPQGRPWQGVVLTLIGRSADPELINTWSYLDDPRHMINPDPFLAENFLFSDVRPGEYEIYTKLQGVEYRIPVTVTGGELSTVELITEPYKSPTSEPPSDE